MGRPNLGLEAPPGVGFLAFDLRQAQAARALGLTA
jgi:hypothetical protein